MNLLITGSSGFVGSALYRYISSIPEVNCMGVSRNGANSDFSFDELFDSEILSKVDVIIHTIGKAHGGNGDNLKDFNSSGIDVLEKLLSNCEGRNIRRVVLLSSVSVYSPELSSISLKTPSEPTSLSGISKLSVETLLKEKSKIDGFEYCIVRSTLVYSANAPGNIGLLTRLLNRFPFLPFHNVRNSRSFIYIENLCELLFLCASSKAARNEVFLASNLELSTTDLINKLAFELKLRVYLFPFPKKAIFFLLKALGKKSAFYQLYGDLVVDSSYTYKTLNWIPENTSLKFKDM